MAEAARVAAEQAAAAEAARVAAEQAAAEQAVAEQQEQHLAIDDAEVLSQEEQRILAEGFTGNDGTSYSPSTVQRGWYELGIRPGETGNRSTPEIRPTSARASPARTSTVTARSASTAAFDDAEGNGVPLQTVPGLEPTEHENQLPLDQGILTFSP